MIRVFMILWLKRLKWNLLIRHSTWTFSCFIQKIKLKIIIISFYVNDKCTFCTYIITASFNIYLFFVHIHNSVYLYLNIRISSSGLYKDTKHVAVSSSQIFVVNSFLSFLYALFTQILFCKNHIKIEINSSHMCLGTYWSLFMDYILFSN